MKGICPAAATGEAVGDDTETVGTEEVQAAGGTLRPLSSPRSSPVSSLKLTLLRWEFVLIVLRISDYLIVDATCPTIKFFSHH